MNKPRILMVNEFSGLVTGYSTYGMEILKRLYNSGKYKVAELGCYISPEDPRIKQVPWKVYANYPQAANTEEIKSFKTNSNNEFGSYAFESVCIDFKPDIVFDIRDWWMLEFEERSPFRRLFKWAIMPTVDAAPQHEQWIASYMNADAVCTYSDWGAQTLAKEGGSLINIKGAAPPGADTQIFLPMNKKEVRKHFGFEDDVFLIGTVMRNQGRKLYPQLIDAFVEFLAKAPAKIGDKSYLYLHTSYPDQGWDIPRLIKQSGVSHKILMTYMCKSCGAVFPSFFMDAVGPCLSCGKTSAILPNNQFGVDRKILARIINLFDCYVQYANSEGFGMPMVEAAACGVTVFATDYSAMSDVVRKVHGYPIAVKDYIIDPNFGCKRAIPNNSDLVDKLIKFFSHTDAERERKSKQARQGVERNYTWEMTAKKWMTVFDSLLTESNQKNPTMRELQEIGHNTNWHLPPRLHNSSTSLPVNLRNDNAEIVRWAILNVLGRPDLVDSYLSLRLIRDLNWGMSQKNLTENYANELSFMATHGSLRPFGIDDMINELCIMCDNNNYWEQRRWKAIQDSRQLEKI